MKMLNICLDISCLQIWQVYNIDYYKSLTFLIIVMHHLTLEYKLGRLFIFCKIILKRRLLLKKDMHNEKLLF